MYEPSILQDKLTTKVMKSGGAKYGKLTFLDRCYYRVVYHVVHPNILTIRTGKRTHREPPHILQPLHR